MTDKLETVGDVITLYLADAAPRMMRTSFKPIRAILRRFAKAHGQLPIADLTEAVFANWVEMQTGLQTEQTRTWALYQAKRPFKWAKEAGLLPEVSVSLFDRRHLKRVEQRKQTVRPLALKALGELLDTYPELRALIGRGEAPKAGADH